MIETADVIEEMRDSVASALPVLREMLMNSSPEPYTIENLWWTKLNVAISVFAAVVGGLGAWFGYKSYVYSKKTADNVSRLPKDTQIQLMISLLVDLMKNYINAILISSRSEIGLKQPSPIYINLFRLPSFSDIFKEDSFYDNCEAYLALNNLKTRVIHYNKMVGLLELDSRHGQITQVEYDGLILKTTKVIRTLFVFSSYIDGAEEQLCIALVKKLKKQVSILQIPDNLSVEEKLLYDKCLAKAKEADSLWGCVGANTDRKDTSPHGDCPQNLPSLIATVALSENQYVQ